ncbi:zinc-ribbon domain-containing protein [bacterium]|nr:zinc-ribbon domain-containing protein [bacterium]
MKIVCSKCNTSYQIDDSRIPEKGLLVKCSACQNKFRVFLEKEDEGDSKDPDLLESEKSEPKESTESGIKEESVQEEIQEKPVDFSAGSEAQLDKKEEKSDIDFSNDRFDSDDELFADDASSNSNEKLDFDDLFSDAPASSGTSAKTSGNSAKNLFDDDEGDDLFSDLSDDIKKKKNDAEDFLKELFDGNPEPSVASQTVFFKNRKTGKITGPVEESQVDRLMMSGEISEDDDISYDGVNWDSDSAKGAEKSDFEDEKIDDNFGSVLFEEGTMIHKGDAEEIDLSGSDEGDNVDHVYIPDEFSESGAGKHKKAAKKGKGRGNSILFYAGTTVATIAILAIIGGGAYYFYAKRSNSADILDNISEQIAVNTGTLADVREALDKDTPEDYMNSIGILKQYIKPDDSAPSAVGLDGQVKMNLLISYNRRIESSASIDDKITTAMKKAAGNADLIKAKALYLYDQKQYDEAAALLQPLIDKSDQEVFYILGLIASGKQDLEKAENFFNTGFIQGGGKSVKIMYALANMKFQNGDTQSAMAFINRIISEAPNYMKAYLLKSRILMNGDIEEADRFLKGVDTNIVAKAEDFQKAEYYQMLASIANRRGFMKDAIKYYEKAVEINQNDTDAITKIADFYVQISDSTKAMEYYDMALKLDPKYSAAIIGKTEVYVLLSQKEKIYLELAKLDLKTLTNPQLLARVAKIYSNIGDKTKALEFYDLAIKSDSSYLESYIAKSQILLMDFNKVKELDQILVVLEKLGKDRYPYHLIKAIIDHKNADYKSAAEHFRLAEEKNSAGDERVYFFYGEFLKDQQRYAEASAMLYRAYKVDPENYDYMQSYVDSLEKEGKWKNIISLLESKTFIEKRKYRSYSSLANAYFHVKEYDKAVASIDHALELSSQNSSNYYLKAKILYTMGRYADAEKEIDTAVVLDMKNFDNYMLYARILSKRGDFKGAVEKIEAAEKLDPHDQDLLLMKGVIYKNLDDYRNALKYFNRVTNKSLKKEAYLEIGESYLQLGRRKEALEYLRKAERSGNRAAEKHIASILYENGKTDQAISYFKKVLRHNKNDVEVMRQLGYIYKEREELTKALSYFKLYLKKVSDYNERKMIENEVYYIQQNLPQGKTVKGAAPEDPEKNEPSDVNSDKNESDDLNSEKDESADVNSEAKELYEEGLNLKDGDPEEAKSFFQEVLKIAPKNSEYYQKALKALNQLDEKQEKSGEK